MVAMAEGRRAVSSLRRRWVAGPAEAVARGRFSGRWRDV